MSKQFDQTVKTVTKNMLRYTSAMECDIQILIDCLLELIESKVYMLRKLVKLKKIIKSVKTSSTARIADSQNLSLLADSAKHEDESLKQLDSLAIDIVSEESQQITSQLITEDNNINKIEPYADNIQDLCCPFNLNDRHQNKPKSEGSIDTKEDLRRYVYKLIDSIDEDKNEDLKKEVIEEKHEAQIKKIGDCPVQAFSDEEYCPIRKDSAESVVYLAKKEYESIIDVLNVILKSYRSRIDLKTRNVAKSCRQLTTDENLGNSEGKIIKNSDSICNQKTESRKKKPILKSTCPTD